MVKILIKNFNIIKINIYKALAAFNIVARIYVTRRLVNTNLHITYGTIRMQIEIKMVKILIKNFNIIKINIYKALAAFNIVAHDLA